jgi:hypothetical protein
MPLRSTLVCTTVCGLAIGFAAGRAWSGAPAAAVDDAGAAATVTRQAEVTELAELRTRVAQTPVPVVCTTQPTATPTFTPSPTVSPSPTATPTPAPPAAMNEPLDFRGTWTVAITDVTKAATVRGGNDSATAKGVYVVVGVTLVNNESENQRFPVGDLVIVDEKGREFESSYYETLMVSRNFNQVFPPAVSTDTVWVFDVAADIGNRFILESRADPTFRVQLEVVLRG